jgi:hypothetical protein
MKKYTKKTDDTKNQEVNEPFAVYQTKNRIKIYNSFEEEAEDNYKYLASLSVEQHFKNAKNLIERVFSTYLKKSSRSNRINFD